MSTMRSLACVLIPVCILVLAISCSGGEQSTAVPPSVGAVLPPILHELLLADASDEITPVVFDHAAHADATDPDRSGACSFCHHNLKDDPRAIPGQCVKCHPLEPEDTAPPDL